MPAQISNGILKRRFVVFVALVALGFTQPLNAQATNGVKRTRDEEKNAILTIFDAAKQLETAVDYTKFLEDCEALQAKELTAKNQAYLKSVVGWAHNRRGELRLETAEQLSAAGNAQAEKVLALAIEDFTASIQANDQRWRIWLSRGIAHYQHKDFKLAVADFTRVIELKPADVKGWFNRGTAQYDDGQYAAAIADFDALLTMQTNDLEARTARGHAYFAQENYAAALEDYLAVAKRLPENQATQINLGDAFQAMQRWNDAAKSYSAAVEMKTNDADSAIAFQRLAWFQTTCPDPSFRNVKSAYQWIDKAVAIGGSTSRNLDTLAAVQAASGDFKLAKKTEAKAIQVFQADAIPADKTLNRVHRDYQTRMASYEEGVPYQQPKK